MDPSLFQYRPLDRTTWIYVSSLMTVALYFKFSRLWSVRNLDLVCLIGLAPGVLLATLGEQHTATGYGWLFAMGLVWLVRLLADSLMVRRPLLEPNLSPGGLTFMGAALLAFLFMHVINAEPTPADLDGPVRLERMLARRAAPSAESVTTLWGPAYPLLHAAGSLPSRAFLQVEEVADAELQQAVRVSSVKTMAILSQLAVVSGLVLIGLRHFGNIRTGVAAAGLYLLMPYTAQMIARVDHVLPGAILVWAVVAYRRPLISGALLALATGMISYPVFLLPLWVSFYWPRGLWRFLLGFGVTLAAVVASLALTASDTASFVSQIRSLVVWTDLVREIFGSQIEGLAPADGFWALNNPPAYRMTVFVMFAVLSLSLALWPVQKNLGTLLSCTTAVLLATQFWHPHAGGTYVAWYLPLLLLTVLRPNLEDRVAMQVIWAGWPARRKATAARTAA